MREEEVGDGPLAAGRRIDVDQGAGKGKSPWGRSGGSIAEGGLDLILHTASAYRRAVIACRHTVIVYRRADLAYRRAVPASLYTVMACRRTGIACRCTVLASCAGHRVQARGDGVPATQPTAYGRAIVRVQEHGRCVQVRDPCAQAHGLTAPGRRVLEERDLVVEEVDVLLGVVEDHRDVPVGEIVVELDLPDLPEHAAQVAQLARVGSRSGSAKRSAMWRWFTTLSTFCRSPWRCSFQCWRSGASAPGQTMHPSRSTELRPEQAAVADRMLEAADTCDPVLHGDPAASFQSGSSGTSSTLPVGERPCENLGRPPA